ncbi:MAG: COX15/CtaA family protein [Flavobacterium sp.]
MKKHFPSVAKTALILVYLVIIAGALVRMTGSGMGCPDWPKCFGYYIPPTDIKELTWTENRVFKKGQVIIKEEKLWVAKQDCLTGTEFDSGQWEKYTKHDYAIFNPMHTWVEYLNRLAGALAGFAVFIMAIMSFGYWSENKKITWLSWLSVIMMGFQGWLGATVVYSVLNPVKITIHMVVALLIVAMILFINKTAKGETSIVKEDSLFKKIVFLTLLLTLIQIALGTQVRQYVDGQVKSLGSNQMQLVFENPTNLFYLHRSFSVIILGLNAFLFLRNRKNQLGFNKINWVMVLIGIEIISGMAMYYLNFPFASQPIHLVIASLLFGIQFYMILEANKFNQSTL